MATPSDLSPDEQSFFTLFRALREATARVSEGFVRRVGRHVAGLVDEERLRHPSVLDILTHLSIDSLNLATRLTGSITDAAPPPKEKDDEPTDGD